VGFHNGDLVTAAFSLDRQGMHDAHGAAEQGCGYFMAPLVVAEGGRDWVILGDPGGDGDRLQGDVAAGDDLLVDEADLIVRPRQRLGRKLLAGRHLPVPVCVGHEIVVVPFALSARATLTLHDKGAAGCLNGVH
jgi:hypothetical protein